MAATPPSQINLSPQTPSTPLHGPAYDNESPRIRVSARLRQKRALDTSQSEDAQYHDRINATARTPGSPHRSLHSHSDALQSPGRTPKRKAPQRAQVFYPPSPEFDSESSQTTTFQNNYSGPHLGPQTTMTDGMLPTPVKTPRKKPMPKTNPAARALFQDVTTSNEAVFSPKKAKKSKRYNGFSLESFRADEDDTQGRIQIYTDSRDQVPEADADKDNPFVEHGRTGTSSKRVQGTAKRRKISGTRPKDAQVERAIRDDDGMVYVFRGKKVFRRFDDAGEEEEEIDPEDLGLLQHLTDRAGPHASMRTLTRKSIKPTRLFQTEEQMRARQLEKEEEAATDIEEPTDMVSTAQQLPDLMPVASDSDPSASTDQHGSSKPSLGGKKKTSPFDAWRRFKSSSAASERSTRSRKRTAPDEAVPEMASAV